MAMTPSTILAILRAVRDHEIRAFEDRRACAEERAPDAVAAAQAREVRIQEALREAIALGRRDIATGPLTLALARAGIVLPAEDPDWSRLAHQTNRVLIEVSRERARREAGDYSDDPPMLTDIAAELAVAPPAPAPMFRSQRPGLPADAFAAAASISVLAPEDSRLEARARGCSPQRSTKTSSGSGSTCRG